MKKMYTRRLFSFSFFLFFFSLTGWTTIYPFHNTFSGAQEFPPNASTARGTIVGTYNDVTNTISYTILFSGLSAPTTAAHFHGPAALGVSAGVTIGYAGFPVGVTAGMYSNSHVLTAAQETQLLAGLWYSNIHSQLLPGGEIRAQVVMGDPATTSPFVNTFSGTQEVPPNASPATGRIIGSYNHATNTISYSIFFSGLQSPTTAAHFHGPAAIGVSTGVVIGYAGFPVGVTSGFYSNSHVLTNTQEMQVLSGLWYSNIHSQVIPSGEIRAQLLLMDILPPVISDPVASPNSLWPPNHKMKTADISYTSTDNFPAAVTCVLSVSSNEAVTGPDDQTSPDWMVSSNNRVELRAERNGSGSGRTYTVTVTCTDGQGNSSSKMTTVNVSHDNGNLNVLRATAEINGVQGYSCSIYPNPSGSDFTINIQSANSNDRTEVRLLDVTGRLVDQRRNVKGSQVLRMGANVKPGVYFIELSRGEEVKQLKLVKLN